MRQKVIAANWKMHGSRSTITALVEGLLQLLANDNSNIIIIFPPSPYLEQVERLTRNTQICLGGQNASHKTSGAYTGDVSPNMLKDFGCEYVILGHSERRMIFGESDSLVAEKFQCAQEAGLTPVLCLGETLEEREAGMTSEVVLRQLEAVLAQCGAEALGNAVIAYEPVWAIGTGLTATPEQAQEIHQLIRMNIAERSQEVANKVPILYGGSVKADNAGALFSQQDIDGGLVGGASLDAEAFSKICKS